MNIDELKARLREALKSRSLRDIAAICSVSHETIRKISQAEGAVNLTLVAYGKIDKGLRDNGF